MNNMVLPFSQPGWRQIVAGILLALVLSACSMKSLYQQLDWIIPQVIEEYLPLDAKQGQELRTNLQKTLSWHRSTQLPEYIHWLKILSKDIQQGINRNKVVQHAEQLKQFRQAMLNYIAQDVATLLFSTRQKQRAALFNAFKKSNLEYQKENIEKDSESIRKNTLIQVNDEFVRWLGHLEPSQYVLIKEACTRLKPVGRLYLENQRKIQNKLREILETNNSFEKVNYEIKYLFTNWEKVYSDEYREVLEYNKSILIDLVTAVLTSTTVKQKDYLLQKIDYYITVFTGLSVTQ